MDRYLVTEYDDVEKVDGYWVVGSTIPYLEKKIEISPDMNPSQICKQLKLKGYIKNFDLRKKVIVSDLTKDLIELKQKSDNRPICRLEKTKLI